MTDLVAQLSGWSTRRKMLIALLGGAVTGLGQAPYSLVWLALIGLLAGFALFQSTVTTRQAAWVGWAFGAGYFALVLSWIVEPFLVDIARHGWMAPFALIAMAGGMALFWGAAFGFAKWRGRGHRGALGLVVFWTIAEVARTYVLTGFPWGLLGYIWLDWGPDQFASAIGPHGLTLLTLFGCWLLFMAILHPRRLLLTPLVVGIGAGVAFLGDAHGVSKTMWLAMNSGPFDKPVVRLIQPNAPQHQKWDPEMIPMFFERSLGFTSAPAKIRAPDVIVWPETSVPYVLDTAQGAFDAISEAAGDVPVVLGIQRRDGPNHYNSMVVLGADGFVGDTYDKSHLVPFGEYVPGGELAAYFGLQGLAARDGGGFAAGDGLRLIDVDGLGRALIMICYEAIFPHEVGGLDERADWLLHITNDAWFGQYTGPQQHLAQARFRSIEQGLPMVRAANTGISAMIDARGQITASLPLGVAGFLDVELPQRLPATLYSRSGDLPVLLLLIAAVGVLLIKTRRLSD